jgi:hypothetical protein
MTKDEMMAAEVERTLLRIKTEEDLVRMIPDMLESVGDLVMKITEARQFDTDIVYQTMMLAHVFGSCYAAHNLDVSPEQFTELSQDGYTTYLEMQMGEPHGHA